MECMRDQFQEGVVLDGRFVTVSPLNHGSFGMVSLARDLKTGELVAVKCLTKSLNTDADDVSQNEELKYHSLLGTHPNIVNLLHSFETESHLFIVLEFCSMGDLYEAIRLSKGPLEREHVREFMLQLISAVEHMHSKGVYHRDIKPENIFLTQDGAMKLGDFGLATIDKLSDEASVGSDRYMAPEQYDTTSGPYDPARADIWAIGICLLNVLFARNPFSAPTTKDPLFLDFSFDRQTLFDIFPTMSENTFEVLNHCLTIDPSKRSLEEMRVAIEKAVSWTTDDEIFDDEFCTEDRDVVQASSDREPLRTPSIQSPLVANGSSFPWAKALHASPQQRQLSVIPDHEFSDSEFDVPDRKETIGSLDSGLGASLSSLGPKTSSPFKSVSFFSNSRIEIIPPRPLLFSNSRVETVPRANSSPISPVFVSNASVAHIPIVPSQKKTNKSSVNYDSGMSTSWSDWVDEEEEEEEERQRLQELNRRTWSWGSEKATSRKGAPSANKENFFDEDVFGIDKLDTELEEDVEWVTGGWEAIHC